MSSQPEAATPRIMLSEVKYSLPEMLAELQTERASGAMSTETLEQAEIMKLFKSKSRAPRAKSK